MASMISPIYDTDQENIKSQLEYAKALRGKGLQTDGQMVGGFYVNKNPWQNFLEAASGAGVERYQRDKQRGIEGGLRQQREDFVSRLPQATQQMERFDPAQQDFGPTQATVQQEEAKPARQYADEMRRYGIEAMNIPGMEAIGQNAFQQAMLAPEKEAERRAAEQARQHDLLIKTQEARRLQQERLEAQAKQDEMFRRTAAQQEKYLYAALAANRGSQSPHTQIAYGPDGKGYLVDMRTGGQTPLENVGKVPGGAGVGAGGKLPVGAQKVQSSLQNLESGLNAYEKLLKAYNPQNADALTPDKRAAIGTAFTDLQMRLKEAYDLGAITGPDMTVLQSALTDPTSVWGTAKGGVTGRGTFEAQIGQSKAALNRQKRNFEQQYGVELPTPAGIATEPMPGAASAKMYEDPAKEARYQAWLRSQGK